MFKSKHNLQLSCKLKWSILERETNQDPGSKQFTSPSNFLKLMSHKSLYNLIYRVISAEMNSWGKEIL